MRRTDSRAQLITFAATVVIAFISFAVYAVHRQQIADRRWQVTNARAETQRKAICAILANIPGGVPPEIQNARRAFSRPHHPRDCDPLPHTTPRPTATPGRAAPTVVLIPGPTPQPAAARPTATSTASPRSTPSHSPTPRPSPSPTCGLQGVIHHPVHCLHL